MSAPRRPVIGLTGGIGAGKSEVALMLGDLGCLVIYSDELARQALTDPEISQSVRKRWGDQVLDAEGAVDRSRLAEVVFDDQAARRELEALIHPWIEKRRRAIMAGADQSIAAFVIDAPLLIEAGLDGQCDVVIFVDADRKIRLRRVMDSRGWDENELNRREAAQMPLDLKRNQADHIIVNNGDLDALGDRVRDVFQQIIHHRVS